MLVSCSESVLLRYREEVVVVMEVVQIQDGLWLDFFGEVAGRVVGSTVG